jgi:putative membrane protein
MMTGMLGALMWLMMGLMLVGIATGGVTWAMRRLRGRPSGPLPPADASDQTPDETLDETPAEILRRRYAAGELDRDEYLRRSRDLTDTEHGH